MILVFQIVVAALTEAALIALSIGAASRLKAHMQSAVYLYFPGEIRTLAAVGGLRLGGEGGIRTHGTVARTPHFECGAFDHSATSPHYDEGAGRTDAGWARRL